MVGVEWIERGVGGVVGKGVCVDEVDMIRVGEDGGVDDVGNVMGDGGVGMKRGKERMLGNGEGIIMMKSKGVE